MCGLIGYVITDDTTPKYLRDRYARWFRKGLYLDAVRGWDSTGIARVSKSSGDAFIMKKAIPAADFIDLRAVDNFMASTAEFNAAMLGHNRAATRGKVTSDNSHPFQHGSVTLMHNGTLTTEYGLDGDFDVDSEAICYTISKCGSDLAIVKVLEDLTGAFALVWHDDRDNSVNFARNSERPLVWQYTKEGLLYASEGWMIEGAASEPFTTELDRIGKIQELPTGSWVKYFIDDDKYVSKEFTPYEDTYSGYGYDYQNGRYIYSNRSKGGNQSKKGGGKSGSGGNTQLTVRENKDTAEDVLLKEYGVLPGDTVLLEYRSHYLPENAKEGEDRYVIQTVLTCADTGLLPNTNVRCTLSLYSRDTIDNQIIGEGKRIFVAKVAGAFRRGPEPQDLSIYVSESEPLFTYAEKSKRLPKLMEADMVYRSLTDVDTSSPSDDDPDGCGYYDADGKEITKERLIDITRGKCAWCDDDVMEAVESEDAEWYDGYLFHKECGEEYARSYDEGDEAETDEKTDDTEEEK